VVTSAIGGSARRWTTSGPAPGDAIATPARWTRQAPHWVIHAGPRSRPASVKLPGPS